jgi:hypothetical protein
MSKVKWTSDTGIGIEEVIKPKPTPKRVSYLDRLLRFLKFNNKEEPYSS